MADKPSNRDQVKELTDRLEEGIKDLFTSEKYLSYLNTMAQFHNYSARNTILIYMQKPTATKVAGFRSWQEKFKRHVKKGEKGIRILAPTPFTIRKEMEKLDPDTNVPMLDKDGKPVTEEVEVKIPRFKAVSVFDVSQTEGKPLPELAEDIIGDVKQYEVFVDALRRVSPLPIEFEPMPGNLDGTCYFGKRIAIRDNMSEVQTIAAIVHEITHAMLHDTTKEQEQPEADIETPDTEDGNKPARKDSSTMEVEAESVSYVVCQRYGIETGANSFGYLASWGKDKELSILKSSLETIQKTSATIIDDIDKHFRNICKERGIDLTAEKVPEPPIEPESPVFENVHLYFEPDNTPWGERQSGELITDGVFWVSTASHGGMMIHEDVAKELLSKEAQKVGFIENSYLCFEEDCDAAVAIQELMDKGIWKIPDNYDIDEYKAIIGRSIKEYNSEYYTARNPPESEKPPAAETPNTAITNEIELSNEILPDSSIGISERDSYGYRYEAMLLLTVERALELYDSDHSIYLLYPDNTEGMAFDREEIEQHDGIFGIEADEWNASLEYKAMKESLNNSEATKESELIYGKDNKFGIYQLKGGADTRDLRFEPYQRLQNEGLTADRANYELVYTGSLSENDDLEQIFNRFNLDRPEDFKGHSLSVSDVVLLQREGQVSSYYVDSVGFINLPAFVGDEKAPEVETPAPVQHDPSVPTFAELESQVKEGKQISLLDLAYAVKNEQKPSQQKAKPSILAQLSHMKTDMSGSDKQKDAPKRQNQLEV
ncbi:MAG: YodL domain-containing protein [Lachnospiraceae bacterium]